MNKLLLAGSLAFVLAGAPALAQTETRTKVSHDTSVKHGVATTRTTVTHTTKRKTHRPKRILGIKVGHRTVVHRTVKQTRVSSNGDRSTTVRTLR